MKLPLNWLKKYVEVNDDVNSLSDTLTGIGYMQDHRPEKVGTDTVLDIEVRQNRSDCLSVIGVARELSAALNKPLTMPESYDKELPTVSSKSTVEIKNPDLCYRFSTVTIENIKVAPSPSWLKEALTAYGIKSINNVVDITNFVMVEIGEPLHAFDLKKLNTANLVIRRANKGETLTVLGQKKLMLTPKI